MISAYEAEKQSRGMHSLVAPEAIEYLIEHTAENEHDVMSEVDRYIVYPSQATATRSACSKSTRRTTKPKLNGVRVRLQAFDDHVLEEGAVPLNCRREKIPTWPTLLSEHAMTSDSTVNM